MGHAFPYTCRDVQSVAHGDLQDALHAPYKEEEHDPWRSQQGSHTEGGEHDHLDMGMGPLGKQVLQGKEVPQRLQDKELVGTQEVDRHQEQEDNHLAQQEGNRLAQQEDNLEVDIREVELLDT